MFFFFFFGFTFLYIFVQQFIYVKFYTFEMQTKNEKEERIYIKKKK